MVLKSLIPVWSMKNCPLLTDALFMIGLQWKVCVFDDFYYCKYQSKLIVLLLMYWKDLFWENEKNILFLDVLLKWLSVVLAVNVQRQKGKILNTKYILVQTHPMFRNRSIDKRMTPPSAMDLSRSVDIPRVLLEIHSEVRSVPTIADRHYSS